jgi:hypothetical protein
MDHLDPFSDDAYNAMITKPAKPVVRHQARPGTSCTPLCGCPTTDRCTDRLGVFLPDGRLDFRQPDGYRACQRCREIIDPIFFNGMTRRELELQSQAEIAAESAWLRYAESPGSTDAHAINLT